jgi:hypothetical protein
MAIAYNATIRNTRLDSITTAIDAGAGAGVIEIYDGTRPATGAAITTETLGASLTMSDPSFPGAAAGTMTANAITGDASADATITASWFRVTDSVGTFVIDGDVGTSGSDLNLNSIALQAGAAVDITSFVLTAGNP